MHASDTTPPPRWPVPSQEARRALRLAWISLALLPFSVVGAMVLGDWLLTVNGYDSGTEDMQVGAVLKAGLPAVLVLVAPTLSGAWFGLKAKRLGHPNWTAPVLAAGLVAAVSIGMNLLQVLVALVRSL